ncbi:MAG: PqqD family protein [Planctomycetota bacterium]
METPRRSRSLHVRGIDGETVILDHETNQMHTLNVTASFVFHAIDGRKTVAEISRELAERFEVPLEVAERDACAAIQRFAELKLVDPGAP